MKIMVSQIKLYNVNLTEEKDQLESRLSGFDDKKVKLKCSDKHKDKILRKYKQNK